MSQITLSLRLFLVCACAALWYAPLAVEAAMSSTNFSIDSDVIGSFGGSSTSTNFHLDDTGGEVGTGASSSANFDLFAGFWTPDTITLSISAASDVSLGAIAGSGQATIGSASWTVITNNPGGYELSWSADTADMASAADTVAPFNSGTPGVPAVWNGNVPSNTSAWGGHLGSTSTTVNTGVWGVGDTYAAGKWLDVTTTPFVIATRTASTAGDTEIVHFGAEVGSSKIQPTGSYTANVTLTATTL
jgi:hypothetical protein